MELYRWWFRNPAKTHLRCKIFVVNSGINYQPQLVTGYHVYNWGVTLFSLLMEDESWQLLEAEWVFPTVPGIRFFVIYILWDHLLLVVKGLAFKLFLAWVPWAPGSSSEEVGVRRWNINLWFGENTCDYNCKMGPGSSDKMGVWDAYKWPKING